MTVYLIRIRQSRFEGETVVLASPYFPFIFGLPNTMHVDVTPLWRVYVIPVDPILKLKPVFVINPVPKVVPSSRDKGPV